MKTVDRHLADLRLLMPPPPAVRLPVAAARGHVLAAEVRAAVDLPAFATSAMDGYAVRTADVPGTLEVVGEVAAGHLPRAAVARGRAVRVMTGSALPAGTEAVVVVEDTRLDGDRVVVASATAAGRNLRPASDDLRAGETVLGAGAVVGPAQLAVLLAAGLTEVAVRPRTRVAVISTGDELVDAAPGPVQLVDSNGPSVAAALDAAGADVVHVGRSGDDPATFLAALDALPPVDLVVTTGGVSMGAYDVVKAALAPRGLTFEQVAVQPGRPQGWGRLPGGPAFLGLPGNPVSALVCLELFGRAVLGRERPIVTAVLDHPVEHVRAGRRQYLVGRLTRGRVTPEPAGHRLAGLAQADCLVVVPEEVTHLDAGASVDVLLLS